MNEFPAPSHSIVLSAQHLDSNKRNGMIQDGGLTLYSVSSSYSVESTNESSFVLYSPSNGFCFLIISHPLNECYNLLLCCGNVSI